MGRILDEVVFQAKVLPVERKFDAVKAVKPKPEFVGILGAGIALTSLLAYIITKK